MKALGIVFLCSILFANGFEVADGSIRGKVVDPIDAIIAGASIRVLDETTRITIQTVYTDKHGRFDISAPERGRYLLVVSSPGFSDKLVSVRDLQVGNPTTHVVRMQTEDCDAPDVNCDIFSATPIPPDPNPIVSQAHLALAISATLDLDKSRLVSPISNSGELQVAENGGGLYLTPLHRTQHSNSCGLSLPDHHEENGTAPFRIDGLGPRSEICFETETRRLSKVFVTREIRPGDKQIELSIVTRTR